MSQRDPGEAATVGVVDGVGKGEMGADGDGDEVRVGEAVPVEVGDGTAWLGLVDALAAGAEVETEGVWLRDGVVDADPGTPAEAEAVAVGEAEGADDGAAPGRHTASLKLPH